MEKNGLKFSVSLVVLLIFIYVVSTFPGVLRVTGHEGDLIHTLDAVFRMAGGEIPHINYMTPLGILATAPIAWLVQQGFGPGSAIIHAQLLVCLVFLPMIWWVAMSRLSGVVRYVFGFAMVLLATALVYGGDVPSISLSMYYNRWAWVPCFLIVLTLMLRPTDNWNRWLIDAFVLGFCGAVLLLLKATYFLGLAPFVLVAILYDRNWRVFFAALLIVAIWLAVITVPIGGGEFWRNYAQDLLAVAGSDSRAQPGEDFGSLVGKPAYLLATLTMLVTVIFWRKTGAMREGLLILILGPGLIYITYQNWGNDPKWLFLLAILLFTTPLPKSDRPFAGCDARQFRTALAIICLTIFAPSINNIATSVARHATFAGDGFAPMFADVARADIEVKISTHQKPGADISIPGITFAEDLAQEGDEDVKPTPPTMLLGEELAKCDIRNGIIGWVRQVSSQLSEVTAVHEKRVLMTDLLDPLWLFGPYKSLPGMAPWYYGTDDGFDAAEFVLVPLCPLSSRSRRMKLAVIEDKGWSLREIHRTNLFILLQRES